MSEGEAGKGMHTGEFPLSQSPPGVAPSAPPIVSPQLADITDFQRLSFKIGTIVSAQDHSNADRLLVLTVDLGEPSPRQIVSGIKKSYQAADLIGKRVVVVANLKPATLRGVESQGMVLAGSDETSIVLVSPEKPLPPGSVVK